MSLFALGDLHLSLGTDKPMDIFRGWTDHMQRLESHWRQLVKDEDTVVIAGDVSWGMRIEEAEADFRFLESLPGHKIVLKGNHDYWWSTAAKFNKFCTEHGFENMHLLNNNCYEYEDIAICGTRGWFFEEERSGQHDEKVFKRELIRLESSLISAGEKPKIVFLHYPPLYKGYICQEIIDLLHAYDVRRCFYGHLHGPSQEALTAVQGKPSCRRLCALREQT